ncbi:hypothetical protein D3C72_1943340 [compost metagenome]
MLDEDLADTEVSLLFFLELQAVSELLGGDQALGDEEVSEETGLDLLNELVWHLSHVSSPSAGYVLAPGDALRSSWPYGQRQSVLYPRSRGPSAWVQKNLKPDGWEGMGGGRGP